MRPKHPEVTVQVVGRDGHPGSILAAVRAAMKRNGVPRSEVRAFTEEVKQGDYDHLLQTVMRWVTVQ